MENPVLIAFWEEVRTDWKLLCAEYGISLPDMAEVFRVRGTMADFKDAKKIRKILSDPRLLIYDWLFGERPTDKPADSVNSGGSVGNGRVSV